MKTCKYILIFVLCLVMAFAPMLLACDHSPDWQEQYDLGIRCLQEGRYEEAILAFNAVIEINPNLADAYRMRAVAYEEAAQLQEDEAVAEEYQKKAREDREKAQELDPEPQVTTATTAEVTELPVTTAVTETTSTTTQETTVETTVETTAETRYSGGRETEEYDGSEDLPSFTLPAPTFGTGFVPTPTVTFPVLDPDDFITSEPTEADTAATDLPAEEMQSQTTPTFQPILSPLGTIEGITVEDELIHDEGVAVG